MNFIFLYANVVRKIFAPPEKRKIRVSPCRLFFQKWTRRSQGFGLGIALSHGVNVDAKWQFCGTKTVTQVYEETETPFFYAGFSMFACFFDKLDHSKNNIQKLGLF